MNTRIEKATQSFNELAGKSFKKISEGQIHNESIIIELRELLVEEKSNTVKDDLKIQKIEAKLVNALQQRNVLKKQLSR